MRKSAFLIAELFLTTIILILPLISATSWWIRDDSIVQGLAIEPPTVPVRFSYNLMNDNLWRGMNNNRQGFYWNGSYWLRNDSILKGAPGPPESLEKLVYNLTGLGDWTAIDTSSQVAYGYYWNGTYWIPDDKRVAGIAEPPGAAFGWYSFDIKKGFLDNRFTLWLNTPVGKRIGYYWNGTYWVHDDTRVKGLPNSFGWNMFYDKYSGEWNAVVSGEGGQESQISAYYWNGSQWIEDTERAPPGFPNPPDRRYAIDIVEEALTSDGNLWMSIGGANQSFYGFRYVGSSKNCGGNIKCCCGDTLTSSQIMWYDLNNCAKNGLVIGVSNISLDCNGHSIDGGTNMNLIDHAGIWSEGRDYITVKNCEIKQFGYGIVVRTNSFDNILNNKIHYNQRGIVMNYLSHNNSFLNNNIINNADKGFSIINSFDNLITQNNISENWRGLWFFSSYNNKVTLNNINNEYNVWDDDFWFNQIYLVEDNWWGTINKIEIKNKMHGNISFIPFLCEPYPTNFISNQNGDCLLCKDSDDDGICDIEDKCSKTSENVEVDQNGCSQIQFCLKQPICGIGCDYADWKDDEFLGNPRDCVTVLVNRAGTYQPACAALVGPGCG